MEELINQIKIALDNNLYYLSLQATLSLPDICASLQSKDGKTTEYYDEKNMKYGEIVKTGNKEQYKNENGKLLYSKVTEDEHNYVYYDANNEPMYKIQYLTSEPYAICTYLDKNGNPKNKVRAFVPAHVGSSAEDMFKVPAKNPVENGTLVL